MADPCAYFVCNRMGHMLVSLSSLDQLPIMYRLVLWATGTQPKLYSCLHPDGNVPKLGCPCWTHGHTCGWHSFKFFICVDLWTNRNLMTIASCIRQHVWSLFNMHKRYTGCEDMLDFKSFKIKGIWRQTTQFHSTTWKQELRMLQCDEVLMEFYPGQYCCLENIFSFVSAWLELIQDILVLAHEISLSTFTGHLYTVSILYYFFKEFFQISSLITPA